MFENRPIEKEMKDSYLDYAMSVILSRAIPDIRDGLKPVQRRILYSMYEMGLTFDKPYRKSARIVGEVMGKYHPHGDAAIYASLARMAQPFSMRYPLVDGQGNFGSMDGDPPAAMRYTEARLEKISNELLEDIEYETVDFVPTFDGTLKEPLFLPGKLPNLLINGSSGIAVGMATNIPPHNLGEIVDALIYLIDNRSAGIEELMKYIKGPDFPTGGVIMGKSGIIEAYKTGKGKIILRGKGEINKNQIIFTEIPYEVNKADLLSKMSELSKAGVIHGIQSIKDESNKEGIRIVVKLESNANPEVTLKQIYENTQMEISYGIINLVLLDQTPRVLSLKEILEEFLKHRELMVRRRTEFFLKKAKSRLHILEGLIKALDAIDITIKIIRESKDPKEAREGLKAQFGLDDDQANAILDTRLQRLTNMQMEELQNEFKDLTLKVSEYEKILSNEGERWEIIKEEFLELKKMYGDSRRTEIVESYVETTEEELIPHEENTIILSEDNRLNRIEIDSFVSQRRGGKGVYAGNQESQIRQIITAHSHDYIYLFTDKGKVYKVKAYQIPKGERRSRGKLIENIIDGLKDKVVFIMNERSISEYKFIMFFTERGKAKRTSLEEFKNIRSNGIIATKLKEDNLKYVILTKGDGKVGLLSTDGNLVLVNESEFRPMGRAAMGVTGIKLTNGNKLAAVDYVEKDSLLIVTEKGLGKRVSTQEFTMRHRGRKGMRAIKITEKTGIPVSAFSVENDDEIIIITKNGKTIRIKAETVPIQGRNAQGVRLMDLDENDVVVSASTI